MEQGQRTRIQKSAQLVGVPEKFPRLLFTSAPPCFPMSLQFYNFIHLLGLILLLLGYGALLARAVLAPDNKPYRIFGSIVGGVGLLFLLVSGFGMQAKGGFGWPDWLIMKIGVWVLLGASLSLINRKSSWSPAWWVTIILLASLAAWLGIFGKLTPALL